MMPRWHETVVAATLYDVRHGSAIDPETDSQIPAKVRSSFHNQTTGSVIMARKR